MIAEDMGDLEAGDSKYKHCDSRVLTTRSGMEVFLALCPRPECGCCNKKKPVWETRSP